MSTYVINNRIPKFPLKQHYLHRSDMQKRIEDVFQVWLKERFISNLIRRKACSQLYDFSVWMEHETKVVETSLPEDFIGWCKQLEIPPLSDWGDFLRYARIRVKEIDWEDKG
jgi:hypothetical protein